MSDLFAFFNSVFGLALFFGLLLVAILMPFACASAYRLLKRLGLIAMLCLLVPSVLCLLARELTSLLWQLGSMGKMALVLLSVALNAVAYLIYKLRHRGESKAPDMRRIERQPLMPDHIFPPSNHTIWRRKEEQE